MIVDSTIVLRSDELSRRQFGKLFRKLTFTDADDVELMAYDLLDDGRKVRIPRGAWSMLPSSVEYRDLRSRPKQRKLTFTRTLDAPGYEGQTEALAVMFEQQQGQIIRQPGTGKTQIGLAFAAMCCTPTLVVVHTNDLFKQWRTYTQDAVPGAHVGQIKGSTCEVGHITIAMAQTLKRYVRAGRGFWAQWGCLIIDEEHHAAAETWEWILNKCPAFYRFGLTATKKRADGRQNLVKFYIGPIIHETKFKSPIPLTAIPVESKSKPTYRGSYDWSRMLRQLCADPQRNDIIAKIAVREMKEGNSVLILSRQIKHLEHIEQAIITRRVSRSHVVKVVTGRQGARWRQEAFDGFRDGSVQCVLATQLADEGLDVPRLNRVILTFPGKHDGRIIQQIGRAIRRYPDKKDAIVYDVVDDLVTPLARQYLERKQTYKKLDIKIGKVVRHVEKTKKRNVSGRFQVRRSRSTEAA